ncbi:hypothetical protein TSAR_003419 [Trichomalopsis sarcophagae]|uniref:Uncharacterized protein n=1 Tax=Trichomalopsis sarcophagae TaxID=543379 RepID=A0A232FHQ4_9HYME|nr:hypothetical protein TSAR_003419 [Trichomalopsis sarcophagae]
MVRKGGDERKRDRNPYFWLQKWKEREILRSNMLFWKQIIFCAEITFDISRTQDAPSRRLSK